MRTVQIVMTRTELNGIESAIQADIGEAASAVQTVNKAIGRLSTWALPDDDDAGNPYVRCTICPASGSHIAPELVACYYRKNTVGDRVPDFVLGAVWHNGHWGYHS